MYLWRNLPEGQLLAVLQWLKGRKEMSRDPGPAKPLPAETGTPLPPSPR
jgi:hypothetical protein